MPEREMCFIYIDLSAKLRLPYKLAIDCAQQLDQNLLKKIYSIINKPFISKAYTQIIDAWVDIEAYGNITAIKARDLAELLVHALKEKQSSFVLKIFLGAQGWTEDNLSLLQILQQNCDCVKIEMLTEQPRNAALNQEKLLALNIPSLPKSQLTALYLKANSDDGLIAYTWYVAARGASNLSINLLKSAYQAELDYKRKTSYLIHLQFIRLVAGYFSEAAAEEDIPGIENAGIEICDSLFYAKAYCGMLSNQTDCSKKYFEKINITANLASSDLLSLYRANIYALLQHRLGHTDVAFQIEHQIESKLATQTEKNTQIRYINSLNLARLYRLKEDFLESKLYYDLAYASISGLYSETDHVYRNVNYASLFEGENRLDKALVYWTRAALHWLSMKYPESLGWRAARAILRRPLFPNDALDINEINTAISQKLRSFIEKLNINLIDSPRKLQQIFQKNHITLAENYLYVGCSQGISFICSPKNFETGLIRNEPAELLHDVQKLLAYYHCLPDSTTETQSIIIEMGSNDEVLGTYSEVLARAALLNIQNIIFDGKKNTINCSQLLSSIRIKLSPAVTRIEFSNGKVKIIYNRFYQDKELDNRFYNLFTLLNERRELQLSDLLSEYALSDLLLLEQDKVITLNYSHKLPIGTEKIFSDTIFV
jgi:hypothetical protein